MRTDYRHLPPLDYLVAFEAAARRGGFTAAAEELNVSQAAISRKIRLLEEHLRQALFRRGHRSVALTQEGARYLVDVRRALDQVAAASRALRDAAARPQVDIAATNSVATLWLMPRLQAARRAHPDFEIRLISSDDDAECLRDGVDLAILRGQGDWPGFDAEMLLDEEVFPVCAPGYARSAAPLDRPECLLEHALIEVSNDHPEWMDWRRWLAACGIDSRAPRERLVVNTYPLAVQAARDGLGVALGWRHLVDLALADGSLIRPMAHSAHTEAGYYLLAPAGRAPDACVETFRRWLKQSV